MIARLSSILFCSVAPLALFAQDVELRSPDEFISVEGQIIDFNGVMLRVQTTVGAVSVPASEVICFGPGCVETLNNNDFGLTAAAFVDVIAQTVEEAAAAQPRSDTLSVGFADPDYRMLYRTLSGAYAVAGGTSNTVTLAAGGSVMIENADTSQSATLNLANDAGAPDLLLETVSLAGTQAAAFGNPDGWAQATALPHQLAALDALAVVVAPSAGITEISVGDLARVFAGEITNWSQIGGADVSVLPLKLPSESRLTQEFVGLVMEPVGKTVAGNVLTMGDPTGISASINQFPGSISILGLSDADPAQTVPVSGACGIAVTPTIFHSLTGEYPLIRPIMVSYNATPETSLPTELFDFAVSDVAQGLIADEGFMDQTPILQEATAKNARLSGLLGADLDAAERAAAAQMFQVLFDADRTSISITGGAASGPEAGWNRAMLLDLVDLMADPDNAGREVIFVGFGESTSGSDAAISASAQAAEDMANALRAVAGDVISQGSYTVSAFGFGSVSPTTCYDGQVAGSEYTRVEVWIR